MVGDESAGPALVGDLGDAVDVAGGRGHGRVGVAPVGSHEVVEVELQGGQPRQLRADEGGCDRVIREPEGGGLEGLVDVVMLGDERDVVVARTLTGHEVAHEGGAGAVAVTRARALAKGLREGDDAHPELLRTVGKVSLSLAERRQGD